MTQTFDIVRYIKLLRKEQGLRKKKMLLYYENPVEHSELLDFQIIVFKQVIYNRRHDYISLIKEYVTKEIDSLLFRFQFFQIQREDRNTLDDLEKDYERVFNLSIDSKSGEFSLLITEIFDACDSLKSDSEPEEAYGLTEVQFRAFLEKIFLQMKQYSDKE